MSQIEGKFQSKFDIFTIDLPVILSIIVATGVYALLLKLWWVRQVAGSGRNSRDQDQGWAYRVTRISYHFFSTNIYLGDGHLKKVQDLTNITDSADRHRATQTLQTINQLPSFRMLRKAKITRRGILTPREIYRRGEPK